MPTVAELRRSSTSTPPSKASTRKPPVPGSFTHNALTEQKKTYHVEDSESNVSTATSDDDQSPNEWNGGIDGDLSPQIQDNVEHMQLPTASTLSAVAADCKYDYRSKDVIDLTISNNNVNSDRVKIEPQSSLRSSNVNPLPDTSSFTHKSEMKQEVKSEPTPQVKHEINDDVNVHDVPEAQLSMELRRRTPRFAHRLQDFYGPGVKRAEDIPADLHDTDLMKYVLAEAPYDLVRPIRASYGYRDYRVNRLLTRGKARLAEVPQTLCLS